MSETDRHADGEQPRRRLTQGEIIERLLRRGTPSQSSVSLIRNAKGETQIEVSVRTGERDEVETIADAERVAVEVYERLRAKYPMADGKVGGAERS